MLTALQKQGSLIPVSAKNADEDSKPLLDNIGRTASVCDAIFVRELPDFTGGWSRNKGFSPRISAPVSNVAGFEQPPALIVLKNDLGGFVRIFNIGGLYDKFNQISEQRAGSHQHQRHSIFKGSSNWGHLAISQRLPRCSENFSTAQTRQTEKTAFPAVRRVKQWEKSLNCPKSGFINPTSAVKSKTRLKTVKSLLKIWTSPLKSAKSLTAFNPLTFISPCRFQRRQGFLCLKGI